MSDRIRSAVCGDEWRRSHHRWMLHPRNDGRSAICRCVAEAWPPHLLCRLRDWGGAVRKKMVIRSRVGWILKAVCAIPAICVLVALLVCAHGTSGTTYGEVAAACNRAENVHITRFSPRAGEVVCEIWISKEMNVLAMTRAGEHIAYDLDTRRKERTNLASGETESGLLSDLEYTGVQRINATCPSPMLMDAPSDARWLRVSRTGDREVYEWTRTNRAGAGRSYLVKFEVTIDAATKLPQELRLFHNGPATTGWECISQTVFEYPTTVQMKSLIEHACD